MGSEIWIPGDGLVSKLVELLHDLEVDLHVNCHLVKLDAYLTDVCQRAARKLN